MAQSAPKIVHDVLERCSLVVYQTRAISTDRDTGNTVKKGARTIKESVTTFDGGVLKAIHAEKQRGARLCQQYGTKVESLAAWIVANDRVDELIEKLAAVKGKVIDLTEDLASKISLYVETYAKSNPDQGDEIRELGPDAAEVRNSTKILFAAYRVRPEDVTDAGGLSEDLQSLHIQALHEFNMALRDAKANPQGQYFTQGIRDVLGRIATKAESLAFLHPVLEEVASTLQECLEELPKSGSIGGYQAIAVGSLISQLMEPRTLLANGGFKKLVIEPEDDDSDSHTGNGGLTFGGPPSVSSASSPNNTYTW